MNANVCTTICLLTAWTFLASGPTRTDHTVGADELQTAVVERTESEDRDREAVLGLLRRPEVARVAELNGLSLDQARLSVATLSGEELQSLAGLARDLNGELAGAGASISFSESTLIIVILLLVLLLVLF